MTYKQPDALLIADQCDESAKLWANEVRTRRQAAALLRTQHADLARKDALLRRALEALTCVHEDGEIDPGHRCTVCDDYVDRNGPVRAAITKELQ